MNNIPAAMRLPEKLSDAANLTVLVSNAWPQSRQVRGATLEATRRALERFPFFTRVQTVDIPFADERRAFRELVRGSGRLHTYTLTRVLNENNLNLSSLDAAVRRRACEQVIARFDEALEAGASVLGFISGARPEAGGERPRADALVCLEESMAVLCAAARPVGLKIMIEPLDFEAHKRNTLGTTAEAVAMCRRLAAGGADLRLCVDMAHALLNGEDVAAAVELARPFVEEFHVCNAVVDRAHALFGDRHLPLGAPGVVDGNYLEKIFSAFVRSGFLGGAGRPAIACEVLTPEGEDALEHMAGYLALMQDAWAQAVRK